MKAYLYLAKRDGTTVKIIAHLSSKTEITPTRLNDIKQLNLPAAWESAISRIVYNERMKWQAWIETAESYSDLRKSLHQRKFARIPPYSTPQVIFPELEEVKKVGKTKKTMIQRNH